MRYGTSLIIALRACALHLFQGVEKKNQSDTDCSRELLKGFKKLCQALWAQRHILMDEEDDRSDSDSSDGWSSDSDGHGLGFRLLPDDEELIVDDDESESWWTEEWNSDSDEDGEDSDENDEDKRRRESFREPGFGETSTVCLELLIRIHKTIQ